MINFLEADSVIIEFDQKKVLSNVHIKCCTNEITGILGRNGSGKTTLMRIIFGELKTFNKSIRINNEVIHEPYKKRGCISFLPQFNFIPKSKTLKRAFSDFNIDFNDFINVFPEFKHLYKNKFGNLSGGERRLIELFLIISKKSMFSMLDEPFTHIMPVHVEAIKNLIKREKKNKGIIVIDHQYKDVIDVCNKIYSLKNGKTYLLKDMVDLKTLGYIN